MRRVRSLILLMLALGALGAAPVARAAVAVGVSITVAPPALPVYVQPAIPAPGYIWTPGYWAWGAAGYYWVPGTWVLPPAVGVLWTPGYWGWVGGIYSWHAGYWGPHVGFYGGINYGFGYGGVGFAGGFWDHGAFRYNSAVNNFGSVHINNFYNKTVVVDRTINNVSFNGGTGIQARPSEQELAYEHEQHMAPTALQARHEQTAANNHGMLASVNHGHPSLAATSRPAQFHQGGAASHSYASHGYASQGYRPGGGMPAAHTAARAAPGYHFHSQPSRGEHRG
jgi:hypothetical protein